MSPSYTITTFRFDQAANGFVKKAADRELGANEVLVKTTHSGLCYTDVHAKHSNKGCGLGHEGVGTVVRKGDAVRDLKLSQRVGWGWLHHSCGACECCVDGYRQYCADACGFAFGELEQGSMGDYAIRNRSFLYPIPDDVLSENAAPLMCAGASTFEALTAAETRSSDRVGVVGVGGLGHMAIMFARAWGCGVTAFSNDEGKKDDARELGADEFFTLDSLRSGRPASASPVNVLLLCSNGIPELELLLPLLARRARIVFMTIQQEPVQIPYMPFILPGHKIIASTEASRKTYIEMLRFVGRHKLAPWIQKFPMTEAGLADAFATLEEGRMRYRGVLVAE
ncbi:putative nadp-dependent alcohol dehydrogenase protein [Lasiodiplodia theobromae]|uniref:NADP-dependent alcohol dehydrogenase 7 n=1 Tax=Lasiodiplodia theobromae TaxID=45133 RepID=A0A5N5DD71_9PEZI|nr:NADP-dependent alcohol dehydrogenase [Lasiodiplodia theobromae]KAB2575631.1 NADP-dependent alcohol dehydrogenase 7 [Lasiodiplodia theobromae]KAF4545547.1 NADP-dependent alcohol dehydrogenase [Lasiodiplodia theobromae]KAF9636098.1 putative nadp-dependent alcohol dehydrogenase protein [Lasiodiplodia theobromae]